MGVPGEAVVATLNYLLPGFIAAAVFYSLTPSPRPIPFERVVQALIFTLLVQVAVAGVGAALVALGSYSFAVNEWTEKVRLTWSVLVAVMLGILLAWAANTDRIHNLLRALGITCQTSLSSEWYGALSRNKGYVVLHLAGQRRLYGWPVEWPSTPGHGHFVMAFAEWLDESGGIELSGVEQILVRAEDVEMVELMKIVDTREEITHGRSESTDTAPSTTRLGTTSNNSRKDPQPAAPVQAAAAASPSGQEVVPTREGA